MRAEEGDGTSAGATAGGAVCTRGVGGRSAGAKAGDGETGVMRCIAACAATGAGGTGVGDDARPLRVRCNESRAIGWPCAQKWAPAAMACPTTHFDVGTAAAGGGAATGIGAGARGTVCCARGIPQWLQKRSVARLRWPHGPQVTVPVASISFVREASKVQREGALFANAARAASLTVRTATPCASAKMRQMSLSGFARATPPTLTTLRGTVP